MAAEISYAPMSSDDVPEVMEIEKKAFSDPWSTGQFLHELKIPFARQRVAREPGGRIVGYVCWWVVGDEADILNIAVDPDFRRGRVGRALVEIVLGDARAAGLAAVTLDVSVRNDAARAFYASIGFAEAGLRKHYYARDDHALVLRRSMDAADTGVPRTP